jgi:hypothetical protein
VIAKDLDPSGTVGKRATILTSLKIKIENILASLLDSFTNL